MTDFLVRIDPDFHEYDTVDPDGQLLPSVPHNHLISTCDILQVFLPPWATLLKSMWVQVARRSWKQIEDNEERAIIDV